MAASAEQRIAADPDRAYARRRARPEFWLASVILTLFALDSYARFTGRLEATLRMLRSAFPPQTLAFFGICAAAVALVTFLAWLFERYPNRYVLAGDGVHALRRGRAFPFLRYADVKYVDLVTQPLSLSVTAVFPHKPRPLRLAIDDSAAFLEDLKRRTALDIRLIPWSSATALFLGAGASVWIAGTGIAALAIRPHVLVLVLIDALAIAAPVAAWAAARRCATAACSAPGVGSILLASVQIILSLGTFNAAWRNSPWSALDRASWSRPLAAAAQVDTIPGLRFTVPAGWRVETSHWESYRTWCVLIPPGSTGERMIVIADDPLWRGLPRTDELPPVDLGGEPWVCHVGESPFRSDRSAVWYGRKFIEDGSQWLVFVGITPNDREGRAILESVSVVPWRR